MAILKSGYTMFTTGFYVLKRNLRTRCTENDTALSFSFVLLPFKLQLNLELYRKAGRPNFKFQSLSGKINFTF